jgi:hypothetical protein
MQSSTQPLKRRLAPSRSDSVSRGINSGSLLSGNLSPLIRNKVRAKTLREISYVLFVINPGPCRKISHSSIWNVTEEELRKPGKASDYRRVGDCEIYFYNA